MRTRALAMLLEGLSPHKDPTPTLEQYPTSADIAAHVVDWMLAQGDVENKRIVDFGCGNGILGIGCLVRGAEHVTFVDIDERCIETTRSNLEALDEEWGMLDRSELIVSDVRNVEGEFDVVIQNPPFGAQKRGADRPFLSKASELAPVVYSFHMTETMDFVEEFGQKCGMDVDQIRDVDFPIKGMFRFHDKRIKEVKVSVVRLVRK